MYQNIAPAPKSYTAQIRVWAQVSETFARTKTRIRLALAGLWDSLSRTFLRLATPFSLVPLLTRWQQRQPVHSARDHEAKSARRRSKRANRDRSGKTQRKPNGPDPHQSTWLEIDQLVRQGNVRPGLRCQGMLEFRQMVNLVDRVECIVNTTNLAQSDMHLSYVIKDSQTGEQRRVKHSVGLATSDGIWWFVDAGRCCKKLCLAPGGDRFAHPEVYGFVLDSQGNALAPAARREPSKERVGNRASEKVRLNWRVKRTAGRCVALCRRWRSAISSLIKGRLAWITATMLAFWKRTGAST